MRDAVGLHEAQHGDREHAGRPVDAERRLELALQAVGRDRARRLADHRLAALGMGDQHGLAQAGLDRCGGMADVQHEGAAADRGAVHPGRRDAEVMGDLLRGFHGSGDAVDVGQFQPGVRNRVQRGIRVQLDLRRVGNNAELGGLGRADDSNLVPAHGA